MRDPKKASKELWVVQRPWTCISHKSMGGSTKGIYMSVTRFGKNELRQETPFERTELSSRWRYLGGRFSLSFPFRRPC